MQKFINEIFQFFYMVEDSRIYFTRHEITSSNLGIRDREIVDGSPIVQSYSDGPDNRVLPQYFEAARVKGRVLDNEGIKTVVHTGLGRSETSAEIICGEISPTPVLVKVPAFRDVSFGYWDGLSLEELQSGKHAGDFAAWLAAEKGGDFDYCLPHRPDLFESSAAYREAAPPESTNEVIQRQLPELERLIEGGGRTLIVGHGHGMKAALWYLSQDSSIEVPKEKFGEIPTPNNALYRVDIRDENSIAHYDFEREVWVEGFLELSS